MAGSKSPHGKGPSTPDFLPASNPSPLMVDHSFTLQAVMELQRNVGGLTSSIQHLTVTLERIEAASKDEKSRIDGKMEEVSSGLSSLSTKFSVATKVGLILMPILVGGVGIAWTVSQDAVKDIAKSAINAAILNSAQGAAAPASDKP